MVDWTLPTITRTTFQRESKHEAAFFFQSIRIGLCKKEIYAWLWRIQPSLLFPVCDLKVPTSVSDII
jgi:hypothetical protein